MYITVANRKYKVRRFMYMHETEGNFTVHIQTYADIPEEQELQSLPVDRVDCDDTDESFAFGTWLAGKTVTRETPRLYRVEEKWYGKK